VAGEEEEEGVLEGLHCGGSVVVVISDELSCCRVIIYYQCTYFMCSAEWLVFNAHKH